MSTPQLDEDASNSLRLDPNSISYLMRCLRSPFGVSSTEFQHALEVISKKGESLNENMANHEAEIRRREAEIIKEQEEVARHEKEIARHRTAISRHQASLVALQNNKKGLERCVQACKSLLSPIRRLPMEILREISIHFCDRILLSPDKISCPALKLAAVCGSWRHLAFSTSCLWTRIHIDVSDLSTLSLARVRQFELLVDLALKSSRNAPLHLHLNFHNFLGPQPQNDGVGRVITCIKSIAHHSYHWCNVKMNLPSYFLHEMDSFLLNLPLLESLTLHCPPLRSDITNIAPKLRRLDMANVTPDIKLPWDQILTLRILTWRDSARELLTCAKLCTALQHFDITFDASAKDAQQSRDEAHVIHGHVQSLSLSGLRVGTALEKVFTSFTFPKLTNISLISSSDGDGRTWIWTGALRRITEGFFTRSSCAIVSLELRSMPIPDDALISLLQLLPSIQELSISQLTKFKEEGGEKLVHNVTALLVNSLHISHSLSFTEAHGYHLLPNLQKLELTISYDSILHSMYCGAFVEFAKSRWLPDPAYAADIGVKCLKSLKLHFVNIAVGCDFSALECLREAGLKFIATYEKGKATKG